MDGCKGVVELLGAVERLARDAQSLAAWQSSRWESLHRHHAQNSSWYRDRFTASGIEQTDSLPIQQLSRLRPFSRLDLQRQGVNAFVDSPAAHGAIGVTQTSGSTGEPVKVARTALCQQFWSAYGLREHIWWARNFSTSLFVIRANLNPQFIAQQDWGPPATFLAPTGAGYAASMSLSTNEMALLIKELKPGYLLAYPSVLADLINQYRDWGAAPQGLLQVRTMGETLTPALRRRVAAEWKVGVTDTYSSQEVGVIAMQCPSGSYHTMAENLLVEVLRKDGSPCAAGETGDVVVTDLHNYATPMIRYAIGDVAEVGGPCGCGRQLPTLSRIGGRVRNLITYPDGSKRWPRVGFTRFTEIAPIKQYQVVQHAVDRLEVRLVCTPLSPHQEEALRSVILTALECSFPLHFTYWPAGIPKPGNGKHEEVVSLLEDVRLS